MAPNLVTLAGLFPNFLAILAVLYYDTSMAEALPLWVNVFAAFSIFMYQTMDAVDGKQARRTGSSSPLGQLFDHGCDALTTTFVLLLTLQAARCGKETDLIAYFLVTIGAHLSFYIA